MIGKKGNMITGIISVSIGAVLMATVFMSQIKSTNTSAGRCWYTNGTSYDCGWNTSEVAMWGLLGLIGIVGLLYGVLNIFGIA